MFIHRAGLPIDHVQHAREDLADSLMRAGGPLAAGSAPSLRGVDEKAVCAFADAMVNKAPVTALAPKAPRDKRVRVATAVH